MQVNAVNKVVCLQPCEFNNTAVNYRKSSGSAYNINTVYSVLNTNTLI
jgi:hypothetical protein